MGETRAVCTLLDVCLALEVLALDEIRDVVVVFLLVLTLGALLQALVALGELSERGQGVGSKLVQDAGNELGQLLVLTVAVDGEGVGWDGGVDYPHISMICSMRFACRCRCECKTAFCCALRALAEARWERLTLWCGEVDDVAVRLEHVDLLDGLDGLDVHLLEGSLQLLVVGARGSDDLLDLSSGRSLATVCYPRSANVPCHLLSPALF